MLEHVEPGALVTSNLQVEQVLGHGGMAIVYQVRDVTDGSRHALKVLQTEDPQFRRRMLKEGELIASLTSPHLVRLHGELRVDGQPGLLMELARGQDFASFDRSVDVHVSHIRRKLGDEPRDPTYLKTVRGVGYTVPRSPR